MTAGNLEIARRARLKPVEDIANEMGLGSHLLEPYGRDVMKLSLDAVDELAHRPRAKYVVVTPSRRPRSGRARPPRPSASARACATSAGER